MKDPKHSNTKVESLRQAGTWNPRPQAVADELFRDSDFFDARDLVQVKYEMLRRVDKDGQSTSTVAQAFGFSRPSFYKARTDFAREGLGGLIPKRRGRKSAHKLTDEVMDFIDTLMAEGEELGAVSLARRIKQRFGLQVHPRSIERALKRREKKRP